MAEVHTSGPVVVIHQPGSSTIVESNGCVRFVISQTVCGLPWVDPTVQPDGYPRVACRGCLTPERPLPANKVAVDRDDLEVVIKALQTVSRRLGIPAKLLERLVAAWEGR